MSGSKYYDGERLTSLQDMKLSYRNMIEILEKAIESKEQNEITLNDIMKYESELLELKHSGKQFQQFLDAEKLIQMQLLSITEKSINIDSSFGGTMSDLFPNNGRRVKHKQRKEKTTAKNRFQILQIVRDFFFNN